MFDNVETLMEHQKKHQRQLFTCDQCHIVIKNKKHFIRHEKEHNLDKTNVCPICNKSYKRKTHFNRHFLNHNPTINKKICHECGKHFLRNDVLKKHIHKVHKS